MNIKLNEQGIKYGGTKVKKKMSICKGRRKERNKESKNERGNKEMVNVLEATLSYRFQASCKQPTPQYQSASSGF